MSRARLPGGKGWRDDGPLVPIGAPPGPITRTFVPVEPPPVEPPQEDPPVSVSPLPSGPTQRQRETWEAVQRLGSQTAAAKELGITQAGVQGNLRGYMAHMGIDGELPGKLSAEETLRMRTEAGKLGGRPPAAKPEPPPIGIIRNGRTIPATAAEPRDPDDDTVNTYSDISHEENTSAPRGVISIEPDEPAAEPESVAEVTRQVLSFEIRSAEPESDTDAPAEDWELSNVQATLILRAALPEVVSGYRQVPGVAPGVLYTPMQAAERIASFLRSQGFELRIVAINPWT